MPEAVIVATARSPIGRAFKGSLVDVRPDDLAARMVVAALSKVPQLPHSEIEDLMLGCGLPGGEQGFNMARVVSVLAGLPDTPGTTVNRYCASSLQTIRMAAHAIRAGEGDAFIAAGVECVSRFVKGSSDSLPDTENPIFIEAKNRTDLWSRGSQVWERGEGLPDVYIAMGLTAENVARLEGVSRAEQDEYALSAQQNTGRAIARGFFENDITPVTLPNGVVVAKDDGPRPETTIETLQNLRPAFRPGGTVSAGNSCPLNDGAAAVIGRSGKEIDRLRKSHGKPHDFYPVDVASDTAVKSWASLVLTSHGVPDLILNNAGVINANARLWEIEAREFDEVMNTNLRGVVNVIRHFVPAMVARKSGVIVNMSSGWGRSADAEVAPYCATKWAVEGLTQSLAQELPSGMATVALNPGIINTDMLRSCFGGGASSYPSPEEWAMVAVPFLLKIGTGDNGRPLNVPGHTA